ncbi:MAG: hypothetical protein JNG84_07780 [Archangium sp.]|nr:hypothetical protein [Archangium sp.]
MRDAAPPIDTSLLEDALALSPAERMKRHDAALQLVLALRKASTTHYGFDPRAVASPGR